MDKRKNEFTLGIDIDGTTTDPFTFIPHLNQYFKKNFKNEEINTYDIIKLYQITEDDYEEWHSKHGASIYETAPLAEYAKEILIELKKNYHLVFITARSEPYREPTMKWFETNQIPFDKVIMAGNALKCEHAIQNHIDLFLEDRYDSTLKMAERLQIPILLFNTPYNQGPLPDNVIRIHSWKEAKEIIKQYAQQKGYGF